MVCISPTLPTKKNVSHCGLFVMLEFTMRRFLLKWLGQKIMSLTSGFSFYLGLTNLVQLLACLIFQTKKWSMIFLRYTALCVYYAVQCGSTFSKHKQNPMLKLWKWKQLSENVPVALFYQFLQTLRSEIFLAKFILWWLRLSMQHYTESQQNLTSNLQQETA